MKRGRPAIIGAQPDEARIAIERVGERVRAELHMSGQDWQVYEQHGRLVFQDEAGLLDLPMPQLKGRHQIDNAGNAIAAVRRLNDPRIGDACPRRQSFGSMAGTILRQAACWRRPSLS